jgi:hypothetical protein
LQTKWLGAKLGLYKGDTLVYYKSDIKQLVYDTRQGSKYCKLFLNLTILTISVM